jgi:GrpB-like predicted nucleotidyltransferase (UPF0157 family)
MDPEPPAVVAYDPAWPLYFQQIRAHLLPAVRSVAVAVEHIGSTAVPGLAAKPIIDVDVVVPDGAVVPAAIRALQALGCGHRGDLGIRGREAFTAVPGLPPHHLYVVVAGSRPYRDHVDLRDHLRRHPSDAARYAEQKRRLSPLLATDREAYVEGKAELVRELLAAARRRADQL